MPHFDDIPDLDGTDLGNPQNAEAFLDVYEQDDEEHREAVEAYAHDVVESDDTIDAAYALLPLIKVRDQARGSHDDHAAAIDAALADYTESFRAHVQKVYGAAENAPADMEWDDYEEFLEETRYNSRHHQFADVNLPGPIQKVVGTREGTAAVADAATRFHDADSYAEARDALEDYEDAIRALEDEDPGGINGWLKRRAEQKHDGDRRADRVEWELRQQVYLKAAPLDAE